MAHQKNTVIFDVQHMARPPLEPVAAAFGQDESLPISSRKCTNKITPRGVPVGKPRSFQGVPRLQLGATAPSAPDVPPVESQSTVQQHLREMVGAQGAPVGAFQDELRQLLREVLSEQTAQILAAVKAQGRPASPPVSGRHRARQSPRDALAQLADRRGGRPAAEDSFQNVQEETRAATAASRSSGISGHVMGRHVKDQQSNNDSSFVREFVEDIYQYAVQRDYERLPRAIKATERCLDWWYEVRLPRVLDGEAGRWIDRLVRHRAFSAFCGVVVLLHACVSVLETDYLIQHFLASIPKEFLYIEIGFAIWYTIEFCLKILSYGVVFFVGPEMGWNLVDVCVVFVSIFVIVGVETPIRHWPMLRTLRILRVVKILRLLRILQMLGLQRLQMMVNCVLGSLTTLFWCIVMICFTAFIFSVYFVQSLAVALAHREQSNDPASDKDVERVLEFFGSVQKGMLSLFMAISGGLDWHEFWKIITPAGSVAQVLFLFYILFCMIALLNVITSIFVEKALALAQPSAHQRMISERRQQLSNSQKFRAIFQKMDIDDSQSISLREFAQFLKRPEFDHFLLETGIDIKDAQIFFSMLLNHVASDEDTLDIPTLISTCLHIQGGASNLDIQVMRYELRELARKQKDVMRALGVRRSRAKSSTGTEEL